MGVEPCVVFLKEVAEFGCQFDACGTAAYDYNVQQVALLFRCGVGEGSFFENLTDAGADGHCVGDISDEVGVVDDAWGAEGLVQAAWGEDEDVVVYFEAFVFEFGEEGAAATFFEGEIYGADFGLDVFDRGGGGADGGFDEGEVVETAGC